MMYTEPPMEPPPAAEAAVSSFLRLRCCRNLAFLHPLNCISTRRGKVEVLYVSYQSQRFALIPI